MSKKFPRMPHLPWSPGKGSDDKTLSSVSHLLNLPVIITEKMDGSNLCMTCADVFARSHSSWPTHKSFDMAKALHSTVKNNITKDISVFGEWCYAVHSIEYTSLPGYFIVFAVRDDRDQCWLDWREVEEIAWGLGFPTLPILFRGTILNETELESLTTSLSLERSGFGDIREGIVIRYFNEFYDFYNNVAKWVKNNHPSTPDEHWMSKPIKKQGLK